MSNPYVLLCGTCTSRPGSPWTPTPMSPQRPKRRPPGPWKRSCRRRCKLPKIFPKSTRTRRRCFRLRARFLPRLGHGLGHPGVREMGTSQKVAEGERKAPLSGWKAVLLWLRGLDLNQRPTGYELPSVSPSAAAQCFPGLFRPEMAQNPKVVPFRSTAIFSDLGQGLGRPSGDGSCRSRFSQ